jgi:hypothetical protein
MLYVYMHAKHLYILGKWIQMCSPLHYAYTQQSMQVVIPHHPTCRPELQHVNYTGSGDTQFA